MSIAGNTSDFAFLVTTDAYRIGGRETFIDVHLREARRRDGARAALLASSVTGPGAGAVFDRICEVPATGLESLSGWLTAGEEQCRDRRPELLWGHHFRLLHAWTLGVRLGRPLLPTFHGPLSSTGLPTDPLEQLGVAIVLNRVPLLSAVSEEIAGSLRAFCDRAQQVRLLPNRVQVDNAPASQPRKRVRLLLMTRRQKLEHIRRAVELAGLWRRRIGPVELAIHCDGGGSGVMALGTLLGRKWLLGGWNRWIGAATVRLEGISREPEAEARRADVVLGMGRAILEGLAAKRPCILIGYDEVMGLVTNDNFERFAVTNFSGRSCRSQPARQAVEEAAAALHAGTALSPANLAKIDIAAGWDDVRGVMQEAMAANRPTPEDVALAEMLASAARAASDRNDFLSRALPHLPEGERLTFDRLSKAAA